MDPQLTWRENYKLMCKYPTRAISDDDFVWSVNVYVGGGPVYYDYDSEDDDPNNLDNVTRYPIQLVA